MTDAYPSSGHWNALALTCLGAAGTALGGVLVCLQPKMDFQRLGLLQVSNMYAWYQPVWRPAGELEALQLEKRPSVALRCAALLLMPALPPL